MGTTVQLTLIGRQRDNTGEETVTKTAAAAEYYDKNGTLYLLYEEFPECSEIGAEMQKNNRDAAEIQMDSSTPAKIPKSNGAVVHNRIKYKDNLLEVTRNGAINTRMVFESGKEHMTDYATPYGCLRLGILTHSIEAISPTTNKRLPDSPSAPIAPESDAIAPDQSRKLPDSPSVPAPPKPDTIPPAKNEECLYHNSTENWNNMMIRASYSLTADGQPICDCELEIMISFERI